MAARQRALRAVLGRAPDARPGAGCRSGPRLSGRPRALACADSLAKEERLLPGPKLRGPRRGVRKPSSNGAHLLHQAADDRHRPRRGSSLSAWADQAAGLGSRARRRHRTGGSGHPRGERPRARVWIHDFQRRLCARPPIPHVPVVQRQVPRRQQPDGAAIPNVSACKCRSTGLASKTATPAT